MSMLVGLMTIGSLAQSVASSPSAGLSSLADSSALTWANAGDDQAIAAERIPSIATGARRPRREGRRLIIGGGSVPNRRVIHAGGESPVLAWRGSGPCRHS